MIVKNNKGFFWGDDEFWNSFLVFTIVYEDGVTNGEAVNSFFGSLRRQNKTHRENL